MKLNEGKAGDRGISEDEISSGEDYLFFPSELFLHKGSRRIVRDIKHYHSAFSVLSPN